MNPLNMIHQDFIKLFLLSILFFMPLTSASNYKGNCPSLLLNQKFFEPLKYAKKRHQRLAPPVSSHIKEVHWPFNGQSELDLIAKRFLYQNRGLEKVIAKIEIHSDPKEKKPHIVLLFTFFIESNPKKPIGFVARLIKKNRQEEIEAHGIGFYLDQTLPETKGISTYTRDFIDANFYSKMGIRKERFRADYIGRYAWAKQGYSFDTSTYFWLGQRFKSPRKKPLELVRANLNRFLKLHKIKISDLVIRNPGKPEREVKKITDLESPADFAYLFHFTGKTIRVSPLISENTLGSPANMPIGKAFMLSDPRAQPGEPYISSPMGTRFSDHSMPRWYAIRNID